jgi:hypothetical protein
MLFAEPAPPAPPWNGPALVPTALAPPPPPPFELVKYPS